MLLYDIFYGDAFDSAVPLPSKPLYTPEYAVCVNGPKEYLVWRDDRWVPVTQEEALGER